MIGDPSGKDKERALLDSETVQNNAEKISAQSRKLLGTEDLVLVNNSEWLGEIKLIDFLRDVGKHFSINALIQRDFIKERLVEKDQGISYAELSYALLQAYDSVAIHSTLTIVGSDQLFNELAARRLPTLTGSARFATMTMARPPLMRWLMLSPMENN